MWCNTKLAEYRVLYEDSSEDYITLDDINGIDMIFINSHFTFEFVKLCSSVLATNKGKIQNFMFIQLLYYFYGT